MAFSVDLLSRNRHLLSGLSAHFLRTFVGLGLSDHTELGDEIESLLDVQIQGLQSRINADVVLIEAFGLGDSLESLD